MKFLIRWLIGFVAVMITISLAKLFGLKLNWPDTMNVVAFVPLYSILDAVVGTGLRLVFMPLNCLTFGMANFAISATIFYLAGAITQAQMDFWSVVFGVICVSVISAPLNWATRELQKPKKKKG